MRETHSPVLRWRSVCGPLHRARNTGRGSFRLTHSSQAAWVWPSRSSYSRFHLTPDLSPASGDPNAALEDGSAPRGQWQVRSGFSAGTRGTLDLAVFHVGPLDLMQIDSSTRADVYAEWKFTSGLSLVAIGQNLLDKGHFEFGLTVPALLTTEVPRSASIRMRWTFR